MDRGRVTEYPIETISSPVGFPGGAELDHRAERVRGPQIAHRPLTSLGGPALGTVLLSSVDFGLRSAFSVGRAMGMRVPVDEPLKLVNRRRGLLYVTVPVVANTSLTTALLHAELKGETSLVRDRVETLIEPGLTPIAFVRNPWSRLVSCYRKKILNADSFMKLALINRFPGINRNLTFGQFVEAVCQEDASDATADKHWRSQSNILGIGKMSVGDYRLFRFENLHTDYFVLAKEFDLPLRKLPRQSSSASLMKGAQPSDYRQFYDDRLADLVASRYAADIENFGYSF